MVQKIRPTFFASTTFRLTVHVLFNCSREHIHVESCLTYSPPLFESFFCLFNIQKIMVKKNVQQLLSLLPVSYFYDQIVLQFRTAKEFLTSRAPLANVRAAYDYLYSPTQ